MGCSTQQAAYCYRVLAGILSRKSKHLPLSVLRKNGKRHGRNTPTLKII